MHRGPPSRGEAPTQTASGGALPRKSRPGRRALQSAVLGASRHTSHGEARAQDFGKRLRMSRMRHRLTTDQLTTTPAGATIDDGDSVRVCRAGAHAGAVRCKAALRGCLGLGMGDLT